MHRPTGVTPLIESIRAHIAAHGPVSFRWFMEQALYHPLHGYYSSGRAAIGRAGDYVTSVSIGHLYGRILAHQIAQMWEIMGCPDGFAIVEQGAQDGALARDILETLRDEIPALDASVKYALVEPLPRLRHAQMRELSGWPPGKIRFFDSLAEMDTGTLCGVHLSNELLDAMPVHRARFIGDAWHEEFIDIDRDSFRTVYGPASSEALEAALRRMPPAPTQNFTTEINLRALAWVGDVARVLRRGYILTVDYGYPRHLYLHPSRHAGTLTRYRRHARSDNPFLEIGEADLTSHVEFTSLAERAGECGLALLGFVDQHRFMVGAGERWMAETQNATRDGTPDAARRAEIRQFQTLMHPDALGARFSCLLLGRDVPVQPLPSGFRHAPPARSALGLG